MMKTGKLIAAINRAYARLPRLTGLTALMARLFVGGFFMSTGWGKMQHLPQSA